MSSSDLHLGLYIGTTEFTSKLPPNTVNLYDNTESRTALAFTLVMQSTDTRPEVGQPVYLSNGTSYVYVRSTVPDSYNWEFDGDSTYNTAGYGWIGSSTNGWYARLLSNFGTIQLTSNALKLSNTSTAGQDFVWHSYLGTVSSNAIPINQNETYRISCDIDMALTSSNYAGNAIDVRLFAGVAASTLGQIAEIYTTYGGTKSTDLFYTYANSSYNYFEVRFHSYFETGSVSFSNLNLEKVRPNYIFGGTLDNYSETCFPFTSKLQLDCNAVDFTQMLGKRLVYKSYHSSGLGEYDNVATTESFTGDGLTRTWQLTYPTTDTPTVTVNGFAASVAAVGAASTFGYYYTPSSYLILANTSNNAPASTDTIAVIYTAIVGKSAWDSDIIRDINENFFDGEGITCSSSDYVMDGIRINELNFNYVPGNEAINTICDISGYNWYLDVDKKLHYFPRTENPAPFNINSTSNNWRSLTVRRSRDKYRNKQYILGSYGALPFTESFAGDGYTKTWTVTYPVYNTPTITINGYAASVGVLNVSASTFGYYWSKESRAITGNSTNNALASTDNIKIAYQGLYPVVAVADDGTEINSRKAVEGGSGIYEEVVTSNKSYINAAAIIYGEGILSKYGKELEEVRFETDVDGLQSGQLIEIQIPNNDLNDYYYITQVTAKDVNMATMRYKVTAVSGTDREGWIAFFRSLVANSGGISTEPYVNLTHSVLIKNTGNIMFADSGIVVTVLFISPGRVDSALVDFDVVG